MNEPRDKNGLTEKELQARKLAETVLYGRSSDNI